jgi:glycerol-3-phosphate dehydrogenase
MGEARPFSAAGRRANLTDLAGVELDLLIIGGGITGAGIALLGSQRGYGVGLVEARDFAAGTSSRSSKLVHGGIRYLAQGHYGLVREALQERRRLIDLFPDLVAPLAFLMPMPPRLRQAGMLAAGFWTYDLLSRGSGFPRHQRVSVAEARRLAPALLGSDLRGAWKYWDGQTDDACLTVEVVRRAAVGGALVANYAALTSAERRGDLWLAEVTDAVSGDSLTVRSRFLVNATGVWSEQVEGLTGRMPVTRIRPSKGVHVSFSADTLPLQAALIFPVGDGRVLFAVPWHGHVVVGTTDNDYDGDVVSPGCTIEEEADVLRAVNQFFGLSLGASAVLSRWAGVRPLVTGGSGSERVSTRDLSRRPRIQLDDAGLLTVAGGKLTTFWRMAEAALALVPKPAVCGAAGTSAGSASSGLPPRDGDRDRLPGGAGYTVGDVRLAAQDGMAVELEDALSRRLRLSFVDTAAAAAAAPAAAEVMAQELGWTDPAAHVERFHRHLQREFAAPSSGSLVEASAGSGGIVKRLSPDRSRSEGGYPAVSP